MIIKYMTIHGTWGYLAAKTFVIGRVIIKTPPPCPSNLQPLGLIERDSRFKLAQIREEIGLTDESATILTGDEGLANECQYVVAVSDAGDIKEAYVLSSCRPIYLMTDTGKTIERIA